MGRILRMIADAALSVRKNFLHTLLSILGIVIGVAALVIILSMIDGMEEYAMEQISSTTSLESVSLDPATTEVVDGVRLRKDSLRLLDYNGFLKLLSGAEIPGRGLAMFGMTARLHGEDSLRAGGYVRFVNQIPSEEVEVLAGTLPDSLAMHSAPSPAVVNQAFAEKLFPSLNSAQIVGRQAGYDSLHFSIMAVVENRRADEPATIVLPISRLDPGFLHENPPRYLIRAPDVSLVPVIEAKVNDWLDEELGKGHDMQVVTNAFRVEQVNRGFLLFRIIMSMIVGVSVVVGGIGIMNVMIISVTERIREIGIRKAVGAKRKEILMQFLSEAVTISGLGSFLGMVSGMLLTLGIVPVVRALTEAPFRVAFTWNTLAVVAVLAVLIGVVFGTYPALKASRLDPVEAIRHE